MLRKLTVLILNIHKKKLCTESELGNINFRTSGATKHLKKKGLGYHFK